MRHALQVENSATIEFKCRKFHVTNFNVSETSINEPTTT